MKYPNKKSISNHNRAGKYHWSEEAREKRKGSKNPNWKGGGSGYVALHRYVKRHKSKPELCEECQERPAYDLTNISGEYRRDLDDWKWLCRSCHMIEDGRMENLLKGRRIV